MSRFPRRRQGVAGLAALGVALSGLAVVSAAGPARANPEGTGLVISEVYGGGGNSGATLTHDFIELYNPTDAPISVDGWSVQGRSATNTSAAATPNNVTALTGSVPAGGYYLVQEAQGSGGTDPLPTPDATGTMGMAGGGWQVWLANTTTALDPADGDVTAGTPDPAIIDFVGAATNSASYETAPADEAPSNTLSAQRDPSNTDTDDNAADFTVQAPTPDGPSVAPPAAVEVTIAEIQGDGMASPLLGDPVITEGVVTAAYPAGGFFGFYMQTDGTGGSVDPAARTTSDGIFVRQTVSAGDVTVEPGDFVQVTGTVTEFAGQTQVEVTDAADIADVGTTPAGVTPVTTTTWPATDAQKEALEGMLYSPEGEFTVTNTFATNTFGEVGLARGDTPLIQPTEVENPHIGDIEGIEADNAARAIVLDDAATTNYGASSFSTGTCDPLPVPCLLNGDLTPPYVSNADPVRVGAGATFTDDVILTEGGSPSSPTYRFQPLKTVVGPANAESPATFENTRTATPDAASIDPVGTADLKIASFNVLNYFTTLGDPNDDNVGDGGCLAWNDRAGDGNNVRTGCDPRGAWDAADLTRQQGKIVEAINALDADVVGLMEIENSAVLGETADEATEALVAALNAEAGAGTWAANPSSADLPPVAEQDVITNAIIYRPAAVDRVGPARALGDQSGTDEPFSNAREPIGQAFKPAGGGNRFLVVVNHFKSKGSGVDDGTGQGNANPDRIAQAKALRDWVPTVETDLGVDATFLVGDFNAYTLEDPMRVLYAAGYTNVAPDGEYSYSFSGLSGSLDHVVADPQALAMVTGSDIWSINSGESVALEYSRWNYHSTDFHDPGQYRSSDHDPVVVGLDVTKATPTLKAKVKPDRIIVDKTRAKVIAVVKVDGAPATGKVRVKVGKKIYRAMLNDNGRAVVKLKPFKRTGKKRVKVIYLGNATTKRAVKIITIKVVRR